MKPQIHFKALFRERETRYAALLALAGVLLRVWYLYDFSGAPNYAVAAGADVEEYFQRAKELLSGVCFPAEPDIHAPVYSWFLALALKLFNGSIPAVRILQCALNCGAWFAFYLLLRREGAAVKLRLGFLALAMVMPLPVFYQCELVSESLLAVEAAAVFWLLHASERRSLAAFGAGAALGVMNLTHPMTLLFSLCEVGFAAYKKAYRTAALAALGVLLVVGVWCGAKSFHYHRLLGIQENAAFNVYLGNRPRADGKCSIRPGRQWRKVHREARAEAEKRGVSVDRVFRTRIIDFWMHQPFAALGLWVKKAMLVFSPLEYASGSDIPPLLYASDAVFAGRFLTPALFLLAWFGLWRIFRTRSWGAYRHYLLLFFAMYLAQIITVTSGRYRMLMMAPLFLFAARGGMEYPWRRWWWLPLALVMVAGAFNYTAYGKQRGEAASIYAGIALANGDLDQADELALYAGGHGRYDDPARLENLRGTVAERRGNIAEAAAHYRRAIAREPEMPQGWMNLANLASQAGDRAEAERLYAEALERGPRSGEVLYNYALFRFNSGGECAELLKRLLAVAPANHAGWNLAGNFAFRQGDPARAAECFDRAAACADEPLRSRYLDNRRIVLQMMKERAK